MPGKATCDTPGKPGGTSRYVPPTFWSVIPMGIYQASLALLFAPRKPGDSSKFTSISTFF
jgi:hypothetical protein